jgi:hypothetical protein
MKIIITIIIMASPTRPINIAHTQNVTTITIVVYTKKFPKDNVLIKYTEQSVLLTLQYPTNVYEKEFKLWSKIIPEASEWKLDNYAISIKLTKASPGDWKSLEIENKSSEIDLESKLPSPYSKPKNPEHLKEELKVDDDKDVGNDDEVFMRQMKDYYTKNADDKTRQAMIKSMQESGGTALIMDPKKAFEKDYSKPGWDKEDFDKEFEHDAMQSRNGRERGRVFTRPNGKSEFQEESEPPKRKSHVARKVLRKPKHQPEFDV